MKNPRRELLTIGAAVSVILYMILGCGKGESAQPEWARTLDETGWGKVTDIVRGNGVFIAVGYDGNESHPSTLRAAVWTSPDGLTWTRSPQDNEIFPNGSQLSNIYYYNGLVATGWNRDGEAIIWRANGDGSYWRLCEPVFYDQSGNQVHDRSLIQIKDVMIIPPSPYGGEKTEIAVGAIYNSTNEVHQATIWENIGWPESWQEVHREPVTEIVDNLGDPISFGGSIIYSIIETSAYIVNNSGPAFIAVGNYDIFRGGIESDQDASIWTSDDGEAWSRLQTNYDVFASDESYSRLSKNQRLYTAMVAGKAIYVGGYDESQTLSTGSMIWKSLDNGISWERLTDADEGSLSAFDTYNTVFSLSSDNLPFGYGEVAVGCQHTQSFAYGAFWRGATGYPRWKGGTNSLFDKGELVQVACDGNTIVVVGRAGVSPGIWTLAVPTGA